MKLNRIFAIHDLQKDGDFTWSELNGQTKFIQFCPFGHCDIRVHQAEPDKATATWKWNGDYDNPTITPSIGCEAAPRCGRHVTIINGERT